MSRRAWVGIALCVLMPLAASAQTFTPAQISSLVGLLNAFNVPQGAVAAVSNVLSGSVHTVVFVDSYVGPLVRYSIRSADDAADPVAPTDIALSAATVAESASVGTAIGTLSATDLDAGDTLTYTLTDSAGGFFGIDGTSLEVASSLDYETASTHNITVRATDSHNLTYDETFAITVTDVDDTAPTVTSASASSTPENTTFGHTLTANESVTWSLVGGVDQAHFELSGATVRWASNGTKDYEAPGDTGSNNTYVVTVRATDTANNTTDQTITVTVTDQYEGASSINARYWRVRTTAHTGSVEVGIKHLEFGLLGETAHTPVSAAASSVHSTFVAANAIDGSASTVWIASSSAEPQTLTLDFGSAVDVNVMRLLNRSDTAYATAFDVQYSNDDSNYTTAWSVSGVNSSSYDTSDLNNVLAYPNPTATANGKPLWRLNVTAVDNNSQLSLTELEFRGSVGGADLTGSGRSWHRSTGFGLPSANAFDNNTSTIYHETATNQTGILGYEFDDTVDVAQLYILPRAGNPTQSPEDFTLQSSPDGITWTTELTVTGQTGWTASARTFDL